MSVTAPNTHDRLRWICNTSAEDGIREIQSLLKSHAEKPNPELHQLLLDAQAYEIHGANRSSLKLALARALKKVGPSPAKKSAESALITTAPTEVVQPSWERARQILERIKLHLRLSIAEQAMLGFELLDLKTKLGFMGSGRRKEKGQDVSFKTWEQLVKAEMEISDKTADRMIETYHAAKARLKKLGGQPKILAILDKPASDLTAVERQTVQALVAKITDGATQKELLEELKLVKIFDHNGIGGDTSQHPKKDKKNLGQLAFAFFSPLAKDLRNICTHPDRDKFFTVLAKEEPEKLHEMETSLESALHAVRAAKANRTTGKVIS